RRAAPVAGARPAGGRRHPEGAQQLPLPRAPRCPAAPAGAARRRWWPPPPGGAGLGRRGRGRRSRRPPSAERRLAPAAPAARADLDLLSDDSPLWHELSTTSDQCMGRACQSFEACFVTRMRELAQTADVCIVNHHLYFADLALRRRAPDAGTALLPAHDIVVF